MHSKNLVHCDVKPDIFLVNKDGDVRLVDFAIFQKMKTGLAKLFSGKVKNVQGTMSYMSPEQIRGQTLDHRADIYSFGCTLFELVTGKATVHWQQSQRTLEQALVGGNSFAAGCQ